MQFKSVIELSNKILKAEINIFDLGIWELFEKNKKHYYDFTTEILNYKEQASFFSILDMFMFEKIFCIEYSLTEGCSNCNFYLNSKNYLKPYINVNEPDLLDKISIETIINRNLINEVT